MIFAIPAIHHFNRRRTIMGSILLWSINWILILPVASATTFQSRDGVNQACQHSISRVDRGYVTPFTSRVHTQNHHIAFVSSSPVPSMTNTNSIISKSIDTIRCSVLQQQPQDPYNVCQQLRSSHSCMMAHLPNSEIDTSHGLVNYYNMNRKQMLRSILLVATTTTSITSTISGSPANAATTTTMLGVDQVATAAALRKVKSSYKKLISNEVELYVSTNDYISIKELVRVAPISDIRNACTNLIKLSLIQKQSSNSITSDPSVLLGTTSTPITELENSYKKFISSMERMDSYASLGIRGRKLNDTDFATSYQSTITLLQEFIQLAEQELSIAP
jgi:hypothetical protein